MSGIRFEMNRDFGNEINRHLQKVFDGVFNRDAGKPVRDVKVALKRAFAREGGGITDPELTTLATAISEGRKVKVRAA